MRHMKNRASCVRRLLLLPALVLSGRSSHPTYERLLTPTAYRIMKVMNQLIQQRGVLRPFVVSVVGSICRAKAATTATAANKIIRYDRTNSSFYKVSRQFLLFGGVYLYARQGEVCRLNGALLLALYNINSSIK